MAVFENFPYTNVHELNLNWLIDQMKSLLDEWDAFTTSVDATAQSGSTAGVEVTGSLKEGLTFRFTLPKGDKGDVGNTGNGISTVTFNPNYSLTFNFTDGTSYTTPSLRGAQGEGLEIKDTYPTLQDLKTAHPTGVEGDAYLIGTDPNFILYIWSTRLNDYAMVGALTSPQPSSTTPLMDGVADNGTEFAYARGDHRHPSDTSKVDVTTFNQSTQDIIDDINAINGTIQTINGNITTIEGNVSTNASNISSLQNTKQNNLTAGAGIELDGDIIKSFSRVELIWTNSTPTTPFNTQVVRTGITNAKAFYVAFREKSSSTRCKGVIAMSNNIENFVDGLTFSSSPYIAYARPFTPNFETGTISFEAAYPMNAYGTWGSADNNYAIPYRIYALY